MPESAQLIEHSYQRLRRARDIADLLQHDQRLHRVAMQTVFALEDCHEALVRLYGQSQPPDEGEER